MEQVYTLGSKDTFEPRNECLHLQGYSLKEFVKTGARISCWMCKVKEVPHILNDLSGKLKYFFIMILCDIAAKVSAKNIIQLQVYMQWSSHRLFGCADYFYFFKDEGQHRT